MHNSLPANTTCTLLLTRQVLMSVGAVVVVPVVLVVLVARAMTCASTPPSLTTTSIPLSTPSADLLALCQDYWQWKTQEFPQFSTQVRPVIPPLRIESRNFWIKEGNKKNAVAELRVTVEA
ncbi:hypothetical protein E2C01_039367 [Portunus trituberculatus]|uniref:Uncharacterized protein n=1 Tax=Portunus trituberculatus TaxID=210409 RepID=A0A5B7FEJ9_PORTR|nr:hypothetical protein [Portunus trituberculatus]